MEAATGPVRSRAVLSIGLSETRLWAGSDGGLFTAPLENPSPAWSVEHAGYLRSDGFERTARIDAVASDRSGRLVLHLGRVTPILALVSSADGGLSHEALPIPDPVLQTVDEIGVLDPSPTWVWGAWVARQGIALWVRAVGAMNWSPVELPGSPQLVRGVRTRSDGRLVILVNTASGDAVWATSPALPLRAVEVASTDRDLLDAAPDGDGWLLAHADGIDRGAQAWLRWPAHVFEDISFDTAPGTPRWAALVRSPSGARRIVLGEGAAALDAAGLELEGSPVLGSLLRVGARATFVDRLAGEDRVVVARAGAGGIPSLEPRPARFTEVDLRAITTLDEDAGIIAVGSEFGGEVFTGPAADPDAFVQLGVGPFTSLVTALVTDEQAREAKYADGG